MRYLLDTNIISHIVRDPRGPAGQRAAQLGPGDLLTSVIVLGETAYGLARRPLPKLERQTRAVLRGIEVVGLDATAAAKYGAVRAALEAKGTPIGNNDLWIAAHALALDATLVTANEREFRRVPGLKVENWAA